MEPYKILHSIGPAIDKTSSYAVGGVGIGWGSLVALSSDITDVVGMVTAIVGLVVVLFKLYRDIKTYNRE